MSSREHVYLAGMWAFAPLGPTTPAHGGGEVLWGTAAPTAVVRLTPWSSPGLMQAGEVHPTTQSNRNAGSNPVAETTHHEASASVATEHGYNREEPQCMHSTLALTRSM